MHGKMQKWCPACQAVQKKGVDTYLKTDKGKAKVKRRNASESGKASQERYLRSDKGKAKLKRKRTSENGKAGQKRRLKRYLKTEKGKAMVKRQNDKLSQRILSKIWGMCHDGGIQSVTALQATGCASNEELPQRIPQPGVIQAQRPRQHQMRPGGLIHFCISGCSPTGRVAAC